MKVLVLGATGGTSREVVREAQARGHAVAALVRSPERAQDLSGAHLVAGDGRDEAALSRALVGCEGVISALGTGISPFKEVTLLLTTTKALIAAMRARGTKRLVCITGMGAGDSRGHGGFLYDRLIQTLLLRKVYEDKEREGALVRDSGLSGFMSVQRC
jgi:putative NADH-flavin reductase